MKQQKDIVFHAALRPLEVAALPAKPPRIRGALKQAKEPWRRVERGIYRQKIWVR